ncbi:MAG: hypothetical protein WD638_07555 [Nitriliruptoraceae bacterium]
MAPRICPNCSAPAPGRGDRWCARCGASLQESEAPQPNRDRRGWPLLGIVVLTLAVLAAVLIQGRGQEDGPRRAGDEPTATTPGEGAVLLEREPGGDDRAGSPDAEPGSAAVAPDGEDPHGAPTCNRDGCARWRSTILDHRPLVVNEDLAIHLGLELLIALDVATGEWEWSRGHDDPRGVSPAAAFTALHLDDEVLAIAYGRHIRVHDASTGRLLGEVATDEPQISSLRRHDGRLVASGHMAGTDHGNQLLLGLSDRGQVRFRLWVDRVVREPDQALAGNQPLLVVRDDRLEYINTVDGSVAWYRPLDGEQVDGTVVLDRETGIFAVLEFHDGRARIARTAPGAIAAGVRQGLVVVTYQDRIELFERDGRRLGEVAVDDPARTVLATTSRNVVVATLPSRRSSERPDVRIGRRTGGVMPLPTIDRGAHVPLPPDQRSAEVMAMPRSDGVLLAGPDPRDAWLVPTDGSEIRPLSLGIGPDDEVAHRDGLSFVRDDGRIRVIGPDGSVTAEQVRQVASTDPLLVHGGEGALLLDRSLLDRGSLARR